MKSTEITPRNAEHFLRTALWVSIRRGSHRVVLNLETGEIETQPPIPDLATAFGQVDKAMEGIRHTVLVENADMTVAAARRNFQIPEGSDRRTFDLLLGHSESRAVTVITKPCESITFEIANPAPWEPHDDDKPPIYEVVDPR